MTVLLGLRTKVTWEIMRFKRLPKIHRRLLIARAILLPLALLLPYVLLVDRSRPCLSQDGSCYIVDQPAGWLFWLVWGAALLLTALSFFRPKRAERRHNRIFLDLQLKTTFISALLSVTVYLILLPYSYPEATWLVGVDGKVTRIPEFSVGYPQAPLFAVILMLAYLLTAVLPWLHVFRSKRYIEGFKREELFK